MRNAEITAESGISLDEFFEILDKDPYKRPLIVRLAYKYDFENIFDVDNEILDVDNYGYVWLNDWDEGQTSHGTVRVLGYVAVEDVKIPRIGGKKASEKDIFVGVIDENRDWKPVSEGSQQLFAKVSVDSETIRDAVRDSIPDILGGLPVVGADEDVVGRVIKARFDEDKGST